jgi:hypothetical protein
MYARNSILLTTVRVQGTDDVVERTCADHMLLLGLHDSGCVSTLEVIGGSSTRPASFEVVGDDASVQIVGIIPGTYQIPRLTIEASAPIPPLPRPAVPELSGRAGQHRRGLHPLR